jgi:hypothetical protein
LGLLLLSHQETDAMTLDGNGSEFFICFFLLLLIGSIAAW